MTEVTLSYLITCFILGSYFLIRGHLLSKNEIYDYKFLEKKKKNISKVFVSENYKQKIMKAEGVTFSIIGFIIILEPIAVFYIGKFMVIVVIILVAITFVMNSLYNKSALKKELESN